MATRRFAASIHQWEALGGGYERTGGPLQGTARSCESVEPEAPEGGTSCSQRPSSLACIGYERYSSAWRKCSGSRANCCVRTEPHSCVRSECVRKVRLYAHPEASLSIKGHRKHLRRRVERPNSGKSASDYSVSPGAHRNTFRLGT